MKALQINAYGSASELQIADVAVPVITESQVLIKIKAAAVNPIDAKIRAGYLAGMMPKEFPIRLGWEASGIIEAAGAAVKGLKPGDEVYAMDGMQAGGMQADFAAAEARAVALKPRSLSFYEAAAVPMAATAAYTALMNADIIKEGQRILIHGAAGGVGSFAVQLAKKSGFHVIGTATGEGLELVRSIGADETIDYEKEDFASLAKDLDVVLDLVGGETQLKSYALLKKGGLLLTRIQLLLSPKEIEEMGVRGRFIFTQPDAGILAKVAQWIDSGQLQIIQERTIMPLEQAQQAHEMIENRAVKGKIIFGME